MNQILSFETFVLWVSLISCNCRQLMVKHQNHVTFPSQTVGV
jgi:hypothetical protein